MALPYTVYGSIFLVGNTQLPISSSANDEVIKQALKIPPFVAWLIFRIIQRLAKIIYDAQCCFSIFFSDNFLYLLTSEIRVHIKTTIFCSLSSYEQQLEEWAFRKTKKMIEMPSTYHWTLK
jgi:hypothetical protein